MSLIICADDFGISPKTSHKILDLVDHRKITTFSCMTVFEDWIDYKTDLQNQLSHIDIGIHFTFTGPDFGNPASILWKLLSGTIRHKHVYSEFMRQLDRFIQVTGRYPSHIDGHHHVHQFPIVRDVVLDIARKIPEKHIPIRNTAKIVYPDSKYFIRNTIWPIGGRVMRKKLLSEGVPTNDFVALTPAGSLSSHDFSLFYKKLSDLAMNQNIIWVLHPGAADPILSRRDSLVYLREIDYELLKNTPRIKGEESLKQMHL